MRDMYIWLERLAKNPYTDDELRPVVPGKLNSHRIVQAGLYKYTSSLCNRFNSCNDPAHRKWILERKCAVVVQARCHLSRRQCSRC